MDYESDSESNENNDENNSQLIEIKNIFCQFMNPLPLYNRPC